MLLNSAKGACVFSCACDTYLSPTECYHPKICVTKECFGVKLRALLFGLIYVKLLLKVFLQLLKKAFHRGSFHIPIQLKMEEEGGSASRNLDTT